MSAIDDMKQAVQILRENVRHEAGILYAGVRDNDKTRKAIVALIGGVEEATAELEQLRQERDGLRARVAELEAALQGMLDIVADSRGVAGYHLNGDTAEWDEFDEVDAAEKLLNQLEADNG